MTTTERIPVYVLTGFLGSGKTTLLNNLVKQPGLENTLILINEFGEVGVDHLLVDHSNEEIVVELASGCMCCTILGDFAKTLREIPRRYSRNGERRFDRIIVETTGLADPAPVIHTMMTDRQLYLLYRLQGVITCVDAFNGKATLERHVESQKQAGVADLLLITKSDLLEDQQSLEELKAQLEKINPTANIHIPEGGKIPTDMILQLDHIEPVQSSTPLNKWLNIRSFSVDKQTQPSKPARMAFRELNPVVSTTSANNDVNRHDDHIKAHCFIFDEPFTEIRLDIWLQIITRLMGQNLLRMKGIIHVQGHPGPMVIHGVQHIFHPPAFLDKWPDDDRTSKIVFITYDVPRETLEMTFATCFPQKTTENMATT